VQDHIRLVSSVANRPRSDLTAMASPPIDATYWLDRAEELQGLAERMVSRESRQQMLRLAESYRRLAEHARRRLLYSLPDQLRGPLKPENGSPT
jgi:hypothetical protein